ncbi:16S rRNA (cytosine(1402)-N(4))-methyltransferase RsmH [Microaerobacter geothermalis]|uniref:16S rRNA (cytosine(1402)-N(4))-methyltransferase RsmH n=1 Tax=Microaerobacter geothermalis TaxID=674972 RepID=UPI001F3BADFB|nr:16S rRNA (cytosine(1402)-N(4))-methyltransferase RsmH [Microaerobacter geothermalis]MCF6093596.1 16S rRNA (cytosine(1402)-N(4))-methyltransferase RsmH [Microaerobacter geothermalis]
MFKHITVLKEEAVKGLSIRPNGVYVDCTLGGAGHSLAIASKLTTGRLIAIDQDESALSAAKERLSPHMDKVTLIKSNFRNIKQVIQSLGMTEINGVIFDLGVSSPQLDVEERGFSYNADAPLDMRMDQSSPLTAFDVVNAWDEKQLADVIFQYGEEKFSRRIAKNIVTKRVESPIYTTGQLVEIIKDSIPAPARRSGPHPAKRTFQAIRIAVNDELRAFEEALQGAISLLAKGGRVAVITFHSLEDRICKQIFQGKSQGCTCPPDFPQCVCNHRPELKVITKKPILPSVKELEMNPRSRSAKLRIAEKL